MDIWQPATLLTVVLALFFILAKLLDLKEYLLSRRHYNPNHIKAQILARILSNDRTLSEFFGSTLTLYEKYMAISRNKAIQAFRRDFRLTTSTKNVILYRLYGPSTKHTIPKDESRAIKAAIEHDLVSSLLPVFKDFQIEVYTETIDAIGLSLIDTLPRYMLIFSAGLLTSFVEIALKAISRSEIDNSTIIGIMISNKIRSDTKSYAILLSALVANIALSIATQSSLNFLVMLFIVAMMGCLHVNQKVLEYRVRQGLYGGNEYEAREILQFVLSHADKADFIDSNGKAKKLLPESKPTPVKDKVYVEGELVI